MAKKDAAREGQNSRATNKTGKTWSRAAAHVSARHDTARRAARQELARLGSQAERVARRCPEARQRARFECLARFLLCATRGGRQNG